jgi:hypothetical protein
MFSPETTDPFASHCPDRSPPASQTWKTPNLRALTYLWQYRERAMSFELRQFAVWACGNNKVLPLVRGELPNEFLDCTLHPHEMITIAGFSETLEKNPMPPKPLTATELEEWIMNLKRCLCTVIRHEPTSVAETYDGNSLRFASSLTNRSNSVPGT